jgi:hypothetical protein
MDVTHPSSTLPPFIALCGNPKAGKSEVQKILERNFGYSPIDDGHIIRRFAIDWLNLPENLVYTQEGKASYVEIAGKKWQVRDILGTYGRKLEEMFGEHAMPMFALNMTKPGGLYSFGSVRKTQGGYYKQRGGVVLEIRNPSALPSPYAFDRYDESLIDGWIVNDGTLRDLEERVVDWVRLVCERRQ